MPGIADVPEPPRAVLACARLYNDDLFRLPNVIGVGVARKVVDGRRTNTICVSVDVIRKEAPANLRALHRIPPELTFNGERIPTDVVETPMPRLCQWMYDFGKYRPIPGGCMIQAGAHGGIGTASGAFYERQYPWGAVLLTNNHVLTTMQNRTEIPGNTAVYQPAVGMWGEYIGFTARVVPWTRVNVGAWPFYSYAFYTVSVDAGIVSLAYNVKPDFSVIDIPGKHPFVVLPATEGLEVSRRGITTRLQTGTVEKIGLQHYEQDYNGTLIMLGIGGTLFSIRSGPQGHSAIPGDSGSIVVDSTATRGLVAGTDDSWGGLTYACDMNEVMAALDIETVCSAGRTRLIRHAVLTHLRPFEGGGLGSERLIDEHVGKFDRFRADYLSTNAEARLFSALGALLDHESGHAIAEALLTDDDFAGLLNRAIGPWLVQPTIFEMLEYQLPEQFAPALIGAFTRLDRTRPGVIDADWIAEVFQGAAGYSMREVLDRKVQLPPVTETVY